MAQVRVEQYDWVAEIVKNREPDMVVVRMPDQTSFNPIGQAARWLCNYLGMLKRRLVGLLCGQRERAAGSAIPQAQFRPL